jgi:hypothetical protein
LVEPNIVRIFTLNKKIKVMKEQRGRPAEKPPVVLDKWVQTFYEVPSKPELGYKSVWHFDNSISSKGAYKVEYTLPKGHRPLKVKLEKGKAYSQQPVVMVFKTSDRLNSKTKMKIWNNENIDYILSTSNLIGIPAKAIILDIGVGRKIIEMYKQKYNLT